MAPPEKQLHKQAVITKAVSAASTLVSAIQNYKCISDHLGLLTKKLMIESIKTMSV